MKAPYTTIALALLGSTCWGQTITAPGGTIPADGTPSYFPIEVIDLAPGTIDTIGFGLEQVCIDVAHEWTFDLDIRLVAPDGTTIPLVRETGYDNLGFSGTCFRHDAQEAISESWPPYTGTWFPAGQLGRVNNGQDGNGSWHLRIRDEVTQTGNGTLVSVSLTFGDEPARYFNFTHSDLPIVVIDTQGDTIPNDPKIQALMGIIDNGPGAVNQLSDPFNHYNGYIGIETRGNSSQQFPKKSYGLETWDSTGADINVPLLGMPSESDWVLLSNFSDKSLLNNALTFDIAQRMGRYAPRWRNVEVVLNGEYIGVYLLLEKIKRDGERVDIANLQPVDTLGDELTGGYILKIDWAQGQNSFAWASDYDPPGAGNGQYIRFLLDEPSFPHPAQAGYIQAYVDSFETALAAPDFTDPANGFRRYLDEGSAIDYFLSTEFAKNVDGYRQSTFLYKDKDSNGGELHCGPLWDFDLGYANADYCGGTDPAGWNFGFSTLCPMDQNLPPFWWGRFFEDETWTDSLRCRWESLRYTAFDTTRLNQWVDSTAATLSAAQLHNFATWRILGVRVWPNPQPVPETYAGEIQELKDWMHARWLWLDQNIPGTCDFSTPVSELNSPMEASAFPLPFQDRIHVRLPKGINLLTSSLVDLAGRSMLLRNVATAERPELVALTAIADGAYILRLSTDHGPMNLRVVHGGR